MKEYNIEDYLKPELSKEIIEELVKENIRLELKENAELKAENETLKVTREKLLGDLYIAEESLKDYEEHYKRSEQENAELKAKVEKLDKMTGIFSARLCEKYRQTLQEIKKIVEGIRNATYQFGQEADQKFFNETLGKILQIITKAEVGNERGI